MLLCSRDGVDGTIPMLSTYPLFRNVVKFAKGIAYRCAACMLRKAAREGTIGYEAPIFAGQMLR